jgi:pimeloyl-ACP methyl ester carboxylesterase
MAQPAQLTHSIAGGAIASLAGGSGPPLVAIHHSIGPTGWTPLFADLARDHRLLAPELPGYGASARPDWARDPRDLAILLGMWLDAQKLGPVKLLGLGFGGWIGVELATLAPARIREMVLVGAPGLVPERGRIHDQFLVSHLDYAHAYFEDQKRYAEVFGADPDLDRLEQWEISREMTTRIGWKPYMVNRRLAHLAPELRMPALLVWGERDRVVPLECGERYAKLLPQSRLEIVPGCGHAVDLEQPEVLARMIRGATR